MFIGHVKYKLWDQSYSIFSVDLTYLLKKDLYA